ncbi:MAG: discoidin domain-containing protein [Magnetococcus sp. YQC-3]
MATRKPLYLGANGTPTEMNLSDDLPVGLLPELTELAVPATTILSGQWPGDVVQYDGSVWRNTPLSVGSPGTAGVQSFFNASPAITASSTENAIPLNTLTRTPLVTGELIVSGQVTAGGQLPLAAWLYDTALGVTTIPAGLWTATLYCGVDTVADGRITLVWRRMYEVIVAGMTLTMTGSGSSRTVTAASGTPFVAGDANADNMLASFVQTPKGLYQITGYTSATVVTIAVPVGYVNESAVAWKKWLGLFASTGAGAVVTAISPTYMPLSWDSMQPAFAIAATSKLGAMDYAQALLGGPTTLSIVYDGNQDVSRNSRISTPMAVGGGTTPVTANRALVSDGAGAVAASVVTSTELGYLSGVTSSIQTQIAGKAASAHNHDAFYQAIDGDLTGISAFTGTQAGFVERTGTSNTAGIPIYSLTPVSSLATSTQLQSLTTTQMASLTTAQANAMTTASLEALSSMAIKGMTTTQIAGLSTAQRNAMASGAALYAEQSPTNMTNNTTPAPYVASSKSEAYGTGAWNVFDGNHDTFYHADFSGPSQWVAIDFGSGNAKTVNRLSVYALNNPVRYPGDFKIQGSNVASPNSGIDHADWTVLANVTGKTWTTATWDHVDFANTTAYRHYRIQVSALAGADPYVSPLIMHSVKLIHNVVGATVTFLGDIVVGTPAGGSKGAGAVNAQSVYDDGALLSTCYAIELANQGFIEDTHWSQLTAILPGAEEIRDPATGEILVPAVEPQYIYSPNPGLERFKRRLGTEFDPMNLDTYIHHMRKKGHLTSFPNREKIDDSNRPSMGGWMGRVVEALDIMALHLAGFHWRLKRTEAGATEPYPTDGLRYEWDGAQWRVVGFHPPPYASWVLNVTTGMYEPPVPMPDDDRPYIWSEEKLSWIDASS